MKLYALASFCVCLVLSLILSVFSWRSPKLRLTVRRQFDDWHDLLELFRNTPNVTALGGPEAFQSNALHVAWCNYTLPLETKYPPFCGCVRKAAASFANSSSSLDESIISLVGCMSSRPAWRVKDFWSVRYTTPAIYVFFIGTCFLLVGADVDFAYVNIGLWLIAAFFVILILVADVVHNSFWAFTFLAVVLLINWILLPGMASASDTSSGSVKRTPSCFWWSEYLSAPIFALYVPLMHCGRDFVFASVFTMIGTAIGGLGLRSFWCAEVYNESPKNQFQALMQRLVWLGILAASLSLSMFIAVYYDDRVQYSMGRASVAMLVMTMVISLLQWPGNQHHQYLLASQIGIAAVRNAVLFGVVTSDVFK